MSINDILFPIAILVANIIQGITGFAGSLLAMPPSIHLQGLETARVAVNFYGLISCTIIFLKSYKQIVWKEAAKMAAGMLIGLGIGVVILTKFNPSILLTIYAIFIILVALKGVFVKKEFNVPTILMYGVLLIAGIFQGMFVSGGPLLVIYTAKVLKDKTLVRGTMSIVWIVLNATLAITQFTQGQFTPHAIQVTLLGIPGMFLGIFIGNKIHDKISADKFMKLVYILVVLSGLSLLLASLK